MNSSERGTELSRIINNQTSDIIENIIKKIQEIIVKNKKDFEKVSDEVATGTENVARVYKSALWASIRNDPAFASKSALDIAVEVQKMLSKAKLLAIDYKKWDKILKDNQANKQKISKTQESSTISLSDSSENDSSENYSDSSTYASNSMSVSDTSF
jgi:hypothetical protein